MSGTSLDGLDICLIQFNQHGTEFELLDALTLEYSDEILKLIQDAYASSLDQIHAFDEAYSLWLGQALKQVINSRGWLPDLVSVLILPAP